MTVEGTETRTNAAASPPTGHELTGQWRTGLAAAPTAIEIWGRRETRAAIVRIILDAASEHPSPMDAGTVTAGGTDDVLVVWTDEARQAFGNAWLDQQEAEAKRLLANRWGTA